MNNSAENNNLEIFLRNKTGGIHSRKYSISPSYKKKRKKHNKAQNKNLQSQKTRSPFETGDWEVCFQL